MTAEKELRRHTDTDEREQELDNLHVRTVRLRCCVEDWEWETDS
jgi:hypothetical protein